MVHKYVVRLDSDPKSPLVLACNDPRDGYGFWVDTLVPGRLLQEYHRRAQPQLGKEPERAIEAPHYETIAILLTLMNRNHAQFDPALNRAGQSTLLIAAGLRVKIDFWENQDSLTGANITLYDNKVTGNGGHIWTDTIKSATAID
jgi:hypothetical protein